MLSTTYFFCDVKHYILDEVVDHLMLLSTSYIKLLYDGKCYSLNNVEHYLLDDDVEHHSLNTVEHYSYLLMSRTDYLLM
jgi:hypothetical protein